MTALEAKLDALLNRSGFALTAAAVLLAPWLFAAWEMWYFWPFVVFLMLALALSGLRIMLRAGKPPLRGRGADGRHFSGARLYRATWTAIPVFLLYAGIRAWQAEVRIDAIRSFLLLATSFFVGAQIVHGFTESQRRRFLPFLLVNLLLLGLYGIVNHALTASTRVLWMPGYEGYIAEGRATGTYYCPDHYAGLLEMAFAFSLGLLLARETAGWLRGLSAGVGAVSLIGIVLSKSRGGGLTILVVLAAALAIGFSQWPRRVRLLLRLSACCALAAGALLFAVAGQAYLERFGTYFNWQEARARPVRERVHMVVRQASSRARGRMMAAAWRAWQTQPVFGIGPGMHQNLWPHFAASPDGDRESGKWPTFPNFHFFSYEVHNDWLQLLEEYGAVGLVLFSAAVGFPAALLAAALRRERRRRRENDWQAVDCGPHGPVLGGLLAGCAMAFHSLGDFNLQMPANAWVMASIAGLAVASALQRERAPDAAAADGIP